MFFCKPHAVLLPRIPELVTQKYSATHADQLKGYTDKIEEDVTVANALKSYHGHASATSGSTGAQAPAASQRTAASPDWMGEPPHNFRKRMPGTCIPVTDFDASNSYLGLIYLNCLFLQRPSPKFEFWIHTSTHNLNPNYLRISAATILQRNANVQVALTASGQLWLLNKTTQLIELQHGELFGFNVGQYSEIPAGLEDKKHKVCYFWKMF